GPDRPALAAGGRPARAGERHRRAEAPGDRRKAGAVDRLGARPPDRLTRPPAMFSAFERLVAMRYLRARRQEGFISVIAIFSLLGIALGVATLIIVMSVMNGFRHELMGRILGLNGHLSVQGETSRLTDFDAAAAAVRQVAGVVSATPLIEGQVMATSDAGASGALVRGIRPDDI